MTRDPKDRASATIGANARRANSALEPLSVLLGAWSTAGSHPYLPGADLHGRTSFSWLEGGAFLAMHSEVDHPQVPDGVAIFGSAGERLSMLYFDERGVSRQFEVSVGENQVSWSRDDPAFAQRMTLTISADGNQMIAKGEMARDGGGWEDDLQLTYRRLPESAEP
jgi:hypothetical protein